MLIITLWANQIAEFLLPVFLMYNCPELNMVKWLLVAHFPFLLVHTGITPGHLYRDDQTPSQSHLQILKTWESAPKIKGLAVLVYIKDATYRYWGKEQRGAETRQSGTETTAWEALGNNVAPLFAERFRGQRSVVFGEPSEFKRKSSDWWGVSRR